MTSLHDAVLSPGVFTWDIENNLMYADSAVAKIFGIDADIAGQGLAFDVYLARVHADDRPRVAKAISAAIVRESLPQSDIRVQGSNGHFRSVTIFGRAFKSSGGFPVLYAGIVSPGAPALH